MRRARKQPGVEWERSGDQWQRAACGLRLYAAPALVAGGAFVWSVWPAEPGHVVAFGTVGPLGSARKGFAAARAAADRAAFEYLDRAGLEKK